MTPAREIGGLLGLDEDAAAARLRAKGPNELPAAEHRGVRVAIDVVREPMILLLMGCGTVYLFLGDAREAAVLLASVFVVVGITLYQNQRTERALDALRDLSGPRALVIRGGRERRTRVRSRSRCSRASSRSRSRAATAPTAHGRSSSRVSSS